MDIITCLNNNSGLITAIATVVLVGVTAYYAFINKRILKSNEKSSEEQLRPFIIANIYSEDHLIKFEIKNIGKRPAKNIDIKFEPPLSCLEMTTDKDNKLFSSVPLEHQEYMPPEFSINTVLNLDYKFVANSKLPRVFNTKIKYYDLNNKFYSETYKIDLSRHIYTEKAVLFTDNHFFEEISKNSKEILKVLEILTKKN